jgi:short-subunit dehydrogenase
MTDLKDKVVLITGAGGGFGRHMTAQFRSAGCRLILTDRTVDDLAPAIDKAGDAIVVATVADLSTSAGCDKLVESCDAAGELPDVLVNNAGVGTSGRIDHIPGEMWESMMQLNLLAPMRLCNRLLPAMVERSSGHIVNISSLAGWIGTRGLSAYCASKYGLRGFGEALAEDLESHDIKVTNVYPCFSRTPILDSPQFGNDRRRAIPEAIISEPQDVVAEIIRGVRRNRLHVFPDKQSRRIHILKRYAPWLISVLNRRMGRQAVKATEGVR